MNQTRINYLLKQFASGALTHTEHKELTDLLQQPNRDQLIQYMVNLAADHDHPPFTNPDIDTTFHKIIATDKTVPFTKNRSYLKWWSAAAVLLLAVTLAIFYFTSHQQTPVPITVNTKPEKAPGRKTATLRLADNTIVELDSLGNRLIGTQGGSRVVLENGHLNYQPAEQAPAVTYNTITTPRGGEFMLMLPDGTKVWLNAASSLTFPTAFTGATRTVQLTGEAYFDVTENKQHPFEVQIRDATISVLGTQFNIMGYEDEQDLVTTLVTGLVRIVQKDKGDELIHPGEHAVLSPQQKLYVEAANVEEETAWKNGRIYFTNASIKKIMRQVSRWYDVDIAYDGKMTDLDFSCMVARSDKLSKLLHLLELTGTVNFSMKGNTLHINK